MTRYAKAIAAAAGSVLTVLTAALADDVFSTDEAGSLIASVIAAALTVYAVWATPNREPAEPGGDDEPFAP